MFASIQQSNGQLVYVHRGTDNRRMDEIDTDKQTDRRMEILKKPNFGKSPEVIKSVTDVPVTDVHSFISSLDLIEGLTRRA